jgi:hypothetical protein
VLVVKYLFGGKEHFVEVGGDQSLIIPTRAHECTIMTDSVRRGFEWVGVD